MGSASGQVARASALISVQAKPRAGALHRGLGFILEHRVCSSALHLHRASEATPPCGPLAVQKHKEPSLAPEFGLWAWRGSPRGGRYRSLLPSSQSQGPCLSRAPSPSPRSLRVWREGCRSGERMEGGRGREGEGQVGAGAEVPTRGALRLGTSRAGQGWRPSPGQQRDWVARRRSILPASPPARGSLPATQAASLCFAFCHAAAVRG